MAVIKRVIPFHFLPASWGLVGQIYKEAEATYNFDGEDLERALIDIRYSDNEKQKKILNLELDKKYNIIDTYTYDKKKIQLEHDNDPIELEVALLEVEYRHFKINEYEYNTHRAELTSHNKHELDIALLEIDYRHKKLTEYEYENKKIELTITDELEQKLEKLALDFKFHKISQTVYNKEKATLKEEPYIEVSKSEFDIQQGINGLYFEFEWNDLWIEYLRLNGYSGNTEDQIVEKWFTDLCKSVAIENTSDVENYTNTRGVNIRRLEDGITERS